MKSLIVANWKMNPATWREAKKLFDVTKLLAAKAKKVSIIVAPPAIFLRSFAESNKGGKIALALQHGHAEATGSFTGDISYAHAKDAKVTYVIIGHAERRALGETNEDTRKKVEAALVLGMTPILCIGEKERAHDGSYFGVIRDQLRVGLADVSENKLAKVIIAYEPVWAIGATKAMAPRDMHEMAIFIRKSLVETRGSNGYAVKILYGGSIDSDNARTMLSEGDVDGLLVGRASADKEKFTALIHSLSLSS